MKVVVGVGERQWELLHYLYTDMAVTLSQRDGPTRSLRGAGPTRARACGQVLRPAACCAWQIDRSLMAVAIYGRAGTFKYIINTQKAYFTDAARSYCIESSMPTICDSATEHLWLCLCTSIDIHSTREESQPEIISLMDW